MAIFNTVYKLFLDIIALLSPTSLIGLLKACFICWLEFTLVSKENGFFMKIPLLEECILPAVDEAFEYIGDVANVLEHFLEARLRLVHVEDS